MDRAAVWIGLVLGGLAALTAVLGAPLWLSGVLVAVGVAAIVIGLVGGARDAMVWWQARDSRSRIESGNEPAAAKGNFQSETLLHASTRSEVVATESAVLAPAKDDPKSRAPVISAEAKQEPESRTSTSHSPERPTVAIHYVGDGTRYHAGVPADPTLTQYFTRKQAEEYVVTGLYEYGEAPDVVDESRRRLSDVRAALDALVNRGEDLRTQLSLLAGQELERIHFSYWKSQSVEWAAGVRAYVTSEIPSLLGFLESDPPENWAGHWREQLQSFVASQQMGLTSIRDRVSLDDVGFRARHTEPNRAMPYTSKFGRRVEMRADDRGTVRPRNQDEVQVADTLNLPRAGAESHALHGVSAVGGTNVLCLCGWEGPGWEFEGHRRGLDEPTQ